MNTLPPGLRGYVAAQQQGQQRQMQELQGLGALMGIQGQMQDRQMKEKLLPLQMQEHEMKVAKMKQEQEMNAALGPLLSNPQISPDMLDALGTKLAIGGHPGAATVMNIADKRRKMLEQQTAVAGMRSTPGRTIMPDPQEAEQSADQGTPVVPPVTTQATPGATSFLHDSPYVGPAAKQLQSSIDNGAATNPEHIQKSIEFLLGKHTAQTQAKSTQDAINARQDKAQTNRIEIRNMFPPGAGQDHAKAPTQLTGDALDQAAGRYLLDGTLPPNLGRGAQGAANTSAILNKAASISRERGDSGEATRIGQLAAKANASALTDLSKRESQVAAFERTFVKNTELVEELSKKVDRSGVPLLNKWVNVGKRAVTGDPDLSAFDATVKGAVNEYTKIVSGSMGNVAMAEGEIKKIESLLNAAQTPAQVSEVIKYMKRETQNRMAGFKEQKAELMRNFTPGATSTSGAADAPRIKRYNPTTGKIE